MKRSLLGTPIGLLHAGYIVVSICLFLYSYTQVDLNLTLSRASTVQTIQKAFQYIGFYNRPVSTSMYVGIVVMLFALYTWALKLARNGILSLSTIWRLIWIIVVLVVFSYPAAFSYDFFNYMFTAKTIMVYHKNPYVVIPLQFAGIDPWTNFMRWTHLPSAYTPLWILMTLFPYVVGLGYFVLVLFGIKVLVAGFYLLACLYLSKIVKRGDVRSAAVSMVLFALNPLIIIESLVSGHNDIVMMAFVLVALWCLEQKNIIAAWWYLALSVAAKFVTIVLIPIFILRRNRMYMLMAMIAGLLLVISRRGEMLPWYWVWIAPFVALLPDFREMHVIASVFCFGLLMRYATYIYVGSYDPWVLSVNGWFPYLSLAAGFVIVITNRLLKLRV